MNKKFPFLMDDNIDPTRSKWCYASIVSSGGDMKSIYDSNSQIVLTSKPVPYLLALDGFDYNKDRLINNPDDYYSFHPSLISDDVPELQYDTQKKWRSWSVEGHRLFFNNILRVDFSDFQKNAKIHDIRIQLTSKEAVISHVYAGNRFFMSHGDEVLEYNFMFCIHKDGTVYWERSFSKNEKNATIIPKPPPQSKKKRLDKEPNWVVIPFVGGDILDEFNCHPVAVNVKSKDSRYKEGTSVFKKKFPEIEHINDKGQVIWGHNVDVRKLKFNTFSGCCYDLTESEIINTLHIKGGYDYNETLKKGKIIWRNWKIDNEWYYPDPREDPNFDWEMEGRFIRGKGIINTPIPPLDARVVLLFRNKLKIDLVDCNIHGKQKVLIIELNWGFAVLVKYEFDPPEDGYGGGEWFSPIVVLHERGLVFSRYNVLNYLRYPPK